MPTINEVSDLYNRLQTDLMNVLASENATLSSRQVKALLLVLCRELDAIKEEIADFRRLA